MHPRIVCCRTDVVNIPALLFALLRRPLNRYCKKVTLLLVIFTTLELEGM